MNPNTEFELFTRHIYQKLVNNDVLKPTKVLHNIKLKGKSGCNHQIDVYWEYEIAGNKHRVAIECKNYNSLVPIGKVRDFKGVLDDLNNVNGIMVSNKGFQAGAIKFANQHDISLKQLRKPDYTDVIGEIVHQFHIDLRQRLFLIDEECANKKNIDLQHLREVNAFMSIKNRDKWLHATHLPIGIKNDYIYDSNGKVTSSLNEFENQLPNIPEPNTSVVFKLDNAWIDTQYWGLVKINELKYEFIHEEKESTIELSADMFVEAILTDALNGAQSYISRF